MEAFTLLPDPQTNGGLLVSVKEGSLEDVKKLFQKNNLSLYIEPIGRLMEMGEKTVLVKQ